MSRNSLAARLAKIGVIKHDGAHSGLNSAAREQTLARICDRKKAELGDRVTQHHAEFKQLSTQTKGGVGLFEITFHRTVARPEEEEVEIDDNEKDGDHFSECPPCNEGGEIKRALCWSSEPLGVPADNVLLTYHERRFDVLRIRMRFASSLKRSSTAKLSATRSCREVMIWRRESFVRSAAKGERKPPGPLRQGPFES